MTLKKHNKLSPTLFQELSVVSYFMYLLLLILRVGAAILTLSIYFIYTLPTLVMSPDIEVQSGFAVLCIFQHGLERVLATLQHCIYTSRTDTVFLPI